VLLEDGGVGLISTCEMNKEAVEHLRIRRVGRSEADDCTYLGPASAAFCSSAGGRRYGRSHSAA
jgi:hypothetical protein